MYVECMRGINNNIWCIIDDSGCRFKPYAVFFRRGWRCHWWEENRRMTEKVTEKRNVKISKSWKKNANQCSLFGSDTMLDFRRNFFLFHWLSSLYNVVLYTSIFWIRKIKNTAMSLHMSNFYGLSTNWFILCIDRIYTKLFND